MIWIDIDFLRKFIHYALIGTFYLGLFLTGVGFILLFISVGKKASSESVYFDVLYFFYFTMILLGFCILVYYLFGYLYEKYPKNDIL
jgi:hypothetical protein